MRMSKTFIECPRPSFDTFYGEEEKRRQRRNRSCSSRPPDPPAALPGSATEDTGEEKARKSLKDVTLKVAALNKLRQEKGLPVRKEKDGYRKTQRGKMDWN